MDRFAVIDIGTNSIRLGVVETDPQGHYTLTIQEKEVVRLGEGNFAASQLTEEAMRRALDVCRQFAGVARTHGASKIFCVATAALREATNRPEFLRRARQEARLDVRVISGNEEARLIYMGVVSGIDLADQRALVIDIGGGSTELAVGNSAGPAVLESMKLGSIRLANLFTQGMTGPIPPALVQRIRDYTQAVAVHSIERVREYGFDLTLGSSGTIQTLVEIAARRRGDPGGARTQTASLAELQEARDVLAAAPLDLRRRVPGINPDRADIIVAGATVLVTLLEELQCTEIRTSDRALREGMVIDYIMRTDSAMGEALWLDSVRARSVLQLARRCQADERHAQAVTALAVRLFDEFKRLRLHPDGPHERELLHYAGLLHDVGGFISYTDHHRHGYYLVRNSPLLGFDATEIAMIAALVLHHRKSLPKRKGEATRDLSIAEFRTIERLSICLRLAEAIDRGHLAVVRNVRCRRTQDGILLELEAEGECNLAVWGLESQRAAFRSVFGEELTIRVRAAAATRPATGATAPRRRRSAAALV